MAAADGSLAASTQASAEGPAGRAAASPAATIVAAAGRVRVHSGEKASLGYRVTGVSAAARGWRSTCETPRERSCWLGHSGFGRLQRAPGPRRCASPCQPARTRTRCT